MQPENEPPTKPAQEHPPSWTPSRVSSLAVVAMVLACLPCPPVSLLGAVLGLMALSRIKQSKGAMTGIRLARISIVVGVVLSLASVVLQACSSRTSNEVRRRPFRMRSTPS